eukprot:15709009-Heterocapsa_arctica.AAC.1
MTKVAAQMKENKTKKTFQHSSISKPTMKVKRIWEKLTRQTNRRTWSHKNMTRQSKVKKKTNIGKRLVQTLANKAKRTRKHSHMEIAVNPKET